ncbi:MAG: radical SAM family heme chaperone HemW [Candidatus Nanopelagicales bacterium]
MSPRPFGFYVHVPFCTTRCGYCDFNTYTAEELGAGVSRATYADTVIDEIRWARRQLPDASPVETVFFGGGTPTLLGTDLIRILGAIDEEFGLTPGAEVSTEANPDSVTPALLEALLDGGVNRISFGVQSLAPHVLATLERTHTPGRALEAIAEARRAGFAQVSADLIYATPGETDADLAASVSAVLEAGVDHLSAYSLIVEDGTRLAARVRRGETPRVDDDIAAERYAMIDELTAAAGLRWYEVSNWARPGSECRHNLGYWRDADWWGAGPGAHGHLDGRRWWNLKHPASYARAVADGVAPIAGEEVVDEAGRRLERVLLGMRLREGLAISALPEAPVAELLDDGLVEIHADRISLTRQGRLLADGVVRSLTP